MQNEEENDHNSCTCPPIIRVLWTDFRQQLGLQAAARHVLFALLSGSWSLMQFRHSTLLLDTFAN